MKILEKLKLTSPCAQVLVVAALVAVLRFVYLYFTALDLAPDEAHYWDWSRNLDWSYYSKPPMVAWLMALSTEVFGHTHIGVRFFSVIGLAVLSLVAFFIAKKWRGNAAGWVAFTLMVLTPEFSAGGLLMTPDVPCLVFWALSLYMVTKIDWDEKENSQMKQFITLGIFVGLAGLSKYTAALFFPLLGLFLYSQPSLRFWFYRKEVYVAGVIALLCTLPVFHWNLMHDFVGFKHVMGQGGARAGEAHLWYKTLENFMGGQLGVVGPITFLLLLVVFMGGKLFTERTAKILWWFSAPLFFFFFIKAMGGKVQPNWPVLSIYGGLILLSGWVVARGIAVKSIFAVGLALSVFITVIAHDTFILRAYDGWFTKATNFYIPTNKDPLKPVFGWRGLGHGVKALADRVQGEKVYLTSRYQTAAELGFYMEGNPQVLYINPGFRRQNQMDYWPWPEGLHSKAFIYVKEGGEMEPQIRARFKQCVFMQKVIARRWNFKLREANVYACGGYLGLSRILPEKY